ncbi:MAG: calcium-binding protein [Roseofilum sp. Belize BBD 4]|uniref:calcium-binding protein n=1 Tax=Roseofilum sp. Belize BBD 4 TaxID=2821500 RepID=UPI001B09FE5F|nr:calcium-binding protein [Roseofilum sp. Belize BBD 4]MBP0035731.1 calcium-binding protein [Roseofilum sp. Belize BBD 4]
MSGFTRQDFPNQFATRFWFGTNQAEEGIDLRVDEANLGSQDIVYAYQGDDTISADLSPTLIVFGGQGNDSIVGSQRPLALNILSGDVGNDTIVLQGGNLPQAFGGQGDDSLYGSGASSESMFGGQGNDVVRGRSGNDFLTGDRGLDIIWGDDAGGVGADTILGGQESDTIVGGGGNDSIRGGQGNDYIEVDNSLSSNSPSGDAYVAGNDTVNGDAGNDTIGRSGVAGNDWYNGGDGNDSILGGDQMNAAVGQNTPGDTLIGGAGNDNISGGLSSTASGADSITGGAGNDIITGGGETDNESFQTGRGDTISGGEGNDSILGQAGTDSITGDAGQDTISGGSGGDSLNGGADNDSIYGGAGADSIIGGTGADTLKGGAGRDTLIGSSSTSDNDNAADVFQFDINDLASSTQGFTNGSTTANNVDGLGTNNIPDGVAVAEADYIVNFRQGQDKIEITRKTVTGLTLSFGNDTPADIPNQTIVFGRGFTAGASPVSTNTNFASVLGQVYSTQIGGNTVVYIERDGLAGFTTPTGNSPNRTGDIAVAELNGTVTLQASDFTFV